MAPADIFTVLGLSLIRSLPSCADKGSLHERRLKASTMAPFV
jgi:hypothetical protein